MRLSPPLAALLLALPGAAHAGGHRISIHVRGPVAVVQVERPLMFAPESGRKAIRERGWRGAQVPIDEGVDLRLSVAAPSLGEGERAAALTLKYRFLAPLACKDGRLSLRMPADLDPAPTPAELELHI